MLTLPRKYALAVLQGRGLTLESAVTTLSSAQRKGFDTALIGKRTVPVMYESGMFTIGRPR
jgi:hypothetical protein